MPRRPFLARQGPIARLILKRLMAYEDGQGRQAALAAYRDWQQALLAGEAHPFSAYLEKTSSDLVVNDPHGTLTRTRKGPLVVISNHVHGLHDAFIVGTLLERLDLNFRVVGAMQAFSPLPELEPWLLKVDPRQPPVYRDLNETAKAAAMSWLGAGETVVILPAGRVARMERAGQTPMEYHWKTFAARLIMAKQADVLPLFIHGHPGALAKRAAWLGKHGEAVAMLKMFYQSHGRDFWVSVGAVRPFSALEHVGDRHKLTMELRDMTFAMSQGVAAGDIDPGPRAI